MWPRTSKRPIKNPLFIPLLEGLVVGAVKGVNRPVFGYKGIVEMTRMRVLGFFSVMAPVRATLDLVGLYPQRQGD